MTFFIPRWDKYKDKKPTGSVEIGRNNWAGATCSFATLLQDRTPIDLVSKNTGDVNIATLQEAPFGSYFNFTGATDNYIKFDITEVGDDLVTVVFRSKFGSTKTFIDIGFSDGGRRAIYNTNSLHYMFSSGGTNFYEKNSVFPTGWVWNVLTIDAINNAANWYENGDVLTSPINNVIPLYTSANILAIGSGADTAYPGDHAISDVFVFNEIFDAEQARSISENPYQILKPRRKFFVLGSGDVEPPAPGNKLYLGATEITTLKLGSTDISTVYLGSVNNETTFQGSNVTFNGENVTYG